MPSAHSQWPLGRHKWIGMAGALILAAACVGIFLALSTGRTQNVLDYGAIGDGVTDDAAAIQRAVDAAAVTGGTVTFPAGTFLVDSPIQLKSGVSLAGEPGQTVLTVRAQLSQTFILEGINLSNVSISGLTLRAEHHTANVSGLFMVGAQDCRAKRLSLEGLWYGMKLGSGDVGSGWVVSDIVARECLDPLYVSFVHDSSFADLDLQAVKTSSNQYHAVYLEQECRRLTFVDCTLSGGSGYTLHLWLEDGSSSDLTFTNLTLDATSGRYPLAIGPGFSDIRFTAATLRAGPSGQVVLFYGGDNIIFDGFRASGGTVLVEVDGNVSSVVFRNGDYTGADLGAGVSFENVTSGTESSASSMLPSGPARRSIRVLPVAADG